jgi:hypothetical protein
VGQALVELGHKRLLCVISSNHLRVVYAEFACVTERSKLFESHWSNQWLTSFSAITDAADDRQLGVM